MPESIYELERNDVEGSLEVAELAIKNKTYDEALAHELLMLHDGDSRILIIEKLKELLTRHRYVPKDKITR